MDGDLKKAENNENYVHVMLGFLFWTYLMFGTLGLLLSYLKTKSEDLKASFLR